MTSLVVTRVRTFHFLKQDADTHRPRRHRNNARTGKHSVTGHSRSDSYMSHTTPTQKCGSHSPFTRGSGASNPPLSSIWKHRPLPLMFVFCCWRHIIYSRLIFGLTSSRFCPASFDPTYATEVCSTIFCLPHVNVDVLVALQREWLAPSFGRSTQK